MLKLSDLCDGVSNVRCTYSFHFKETNEHLKIVINQNYRYTDADGIDVQESRSDVCDAVVFDKSTHELKGYDVLLALYAAAKHYWKDEEGQKARNNLVAVLPDIDQSVADTGYDIGQSIYEFVRRVVYFKNKRLYMVGQPVMTNAVSRLVKYINQLDNIEKMCLTIGADTVAEQLSNDTLQFFEGGKKFKSIVGLPLDVVAAISDYDGRSLHHFQNYVKNGTGSVDDLRHLLGFLDTLKKMSRKRKLDLMVDVNSTSMAYIGEIVSNGFSIRSITDAVTREMIMFSYDDDFPLNGMLRNTKDAIAMQREMGNKSLHIPQNIVKWHSITGRNFHLLKNSRQEEYTRAVLIINQNSFVVDGYLIECPTTEKELYNIGEEYQDCLPLYRDKIIDDNAIIYSMYPVNEAGEKTGEIPPVTFEVTSDLDFIQIKTFNDADVIDPEILNVLKKWKSKAKEIRRETD